MRYTVVRAKLPLGVVLEGVSTEPWFSDLLKGVVPVEKVDRRSSTTGIRLGLEVPVGKERETAKALRQMAEELER